MNDCKTNFFKKVVNNSKLFNMETKMYNLRRCIGYLSILCLTFFASGTLSAQCELPDCSDFDVEVDLSQYTVFGGQSVCNFIHSMQLHPSSNLEIASYNSVSNGVTSTYHSDVTRFLTEGILNECSDKNISMSLISGTSVTEIFTLTYGEAMLDVGEYEFQLVLTDGGVPIDNCTYSVTVKEGDFSSIACNNSINVTLDAACEGVITPDMVLEGDYCYNAYSLQLEDADGNILSHDDAIGGVAVDAPGVYTAMVESPFGLRCWGEVVVEDKLPLFLACSDDIIRVFCSQSDDAGEPLQVFSPSESGTGAINAYDPATDLDADGLPLGNSCAIIPITYSALYDNNTVSGVEVTLDIDFPEVNLLSGYLESPDPDPLDPAVGPVSVQLFDFTSLDCAQSNMDVTFSDGGTNSYVTFTTDLACGQGISTAFCGSYKPLQALSAFNGDNYGTERTWNLIIKNAGESQSGTVDASVMVHFHNATIPYPTDDTEWVNNGDGTYTLSFGPNANCGPYTGTYVDEIDPDFECQDYDLDGDLTNGPEEFTLNTFTRTWTVVTPNGAVSTCVQNFRTQRFTTPNDIIFPKSYDGQPGNYPELSCRALFKQGGSPGEIDPTFISLVDTVPLPTLTGYPTIQFGDLSRCGNVQFNYDDTKFRLDCDFSFKVLRKWSWIDWCTGESGVVDQLIKVIDDEGPQITCQVDNKEYNTDPYTCTADIDLAVPKFLGSPLDGPVILFDCGIETWTYSVDYVFASQFVECDEDCPSPDDIQDTDFVSTNIVANGVDEDGRPMYTLVDVPKGCAWIRYTVTDECGNSTECRTEIRVVDSVKPSPVCIEHTIASFDENGCANVYAYSFDNESWDNCGVHDFLARRANSGDEFTRELQFCCDDISTTQPCEEIMIELMVFDYDLMGADDVTQNGDGTLNVNACANYNNCMVLLELQDKLPPVFTNGSIDVDVACDDDGFTYDDLLSYADQLTVTDNLTCTDLDVYPDVSNNWSFTHDGGCDGASRSVTYVVVDACGNEDRFTQTFSFGNAEEITENDISWPSAGPFNINDCGEGEGLLPENIRTLIAAGQTYGSVDIPTVNGDFSCTLTAVSYDDQFFYDVDDDNVCTKVIRTWTVIDWCQYNIDATTGYYQRSQVFKLHDINNPDINNGDITLDCAYLADSENAMDGCDVFHKITLEGMDDCTPEDQLEWRWEVYECQTNTDGDPDLDSDGENVSHINNFWSPGVHTVYIELIDKCGNVTPKTITVTVEDCTDPIPICYGELVISLNEDTGVAEIWAEDFNQKSEDPCLGCDGDDDLTYYFDPNRVDQVQYYDCSFFPNGEASFTEELEMWVFDASGNSAYCTVTLIVQNNGVCDGEEGASRIQGDIFSETNEKVENTMVTISSNQPDFPANMMTNQTGQYWFDSLAQGLGYSIEANKDSHILNGVSTLDIVKIQRHILSIENLNSPYKLIAADANDSGTVTASDLVSIRQAILGIITEFPNGQKNWRLIEAGQTFANPNSPFPYEELIDISSLTSSMYNQDFMAIKIGDVTNNAEVNFGSTDSETRGANDLELSIENLNFAAGQELTIPVTVTEATDLVGMQFTLEYDTDMITVLSIDGAAANISESNLGFEFVNDGYISLSWDNVEGIDMSKDEELFTIKAVAKSTSTLANTLHINSRVISAESYDTNLEVGGINLGYTNDGELVEAFELKQNVPNPFENSTEISFVLPNSAAATLSIFDMNGKVVYQTSQDFNKGLNTMTIDGSSLGASGILYYQLDTDNFTSTKKMIHIK